MSQSDMMELRAVLTRRRPDLLPILGDIGRPGGLDETEREALREVVSEELIETGLDPRDEPNPRGLILERLIDWLGHQ